MVQVDIGGHPPIPLGPPPLFPSFFLVPLFVAQLTIFGSFSGPELSKPFWGPKRGFCENCEKHKLLSNFSQLKVVVFGEIFLTRYHVCQIEIVCQSYDLEKLM